MKYYWEVNLTCPTALVQVRREGAAADDRNETIEVSVLK